MKKIYFVCSRSFYQNEIFNLEGKNNRDNCLYPYYLLKKTFQEKGFDVNTYDYLAKENPKEYALLFHDIPKDLDFYLRQHQNVKKFLFVYESPIKNKRNQNKETHAHFDKVFTWDTRITDNKKYFRVSYSQKIPAATLVDGSKKQKLCCGIFGHKLQTDSKELYSERIAAIRWFEKNHPADFDLYGEGWDRYYFKDALFQLNRLTFLTKLLKPNFPSYKGPVKSKKETYGNYRFAICYENASFPNYITEKIFDCFFGGCVPIYLGDPEIAASIPQNTFIDKRNFATYEALYAFISQMPQEQYQTYLDAIGNFLSSNAIYPFSAEYFAETITREVTASLYSY